MRTEEEISECLDLIYLTQVEIATDALKEIDFESYDLCFADERELLGSALADALFAFGSCYEDEDEKYRNFYMPFVEDFNKSLRETELID